MDRSLFESKTVQGIGLYTLGSLIGPDVAGWVSWGVAHAIHALGVGWAFVGVRDLFGRLERLLGGNSK